MGKSNSSQPKLSESGRDVRADYFKDIADFARSEIAWVQSAYKYAISLVAIVGAVGIWFTFKSASDFRKETREEVERQRTQLSSQVDQLTKQVALRIDEEFKKENIRTLVEEKARIRIDETASVLVEKQMSETVVPQIESVRKRLDEIQTDSKRAKDALTSLRLKTEFTLTAIKAQNDDRVSFDRLRGWAKDASFELSQEAQGSWQAIVDQHASVIVLSSFTVPWAKGVDPAKLTMEHLGSAFDAAHPPVRKALLEYIWNRSDIPMYDKMAFLAGVIKRDQSLEVVEYAGRFFARESKQKLKPLAIDEHLTWWEDNKASYTAQGQP